MEGGLVKRGIDMFAAASGLEVHDEFRAIEFPPLRVINFNHSDRTPHVVDQHGVRIQQSRTQTRFSEATGGGTPDTPRGTERILLAAGFSYRPADLGQTRFITDIEKSRYANVAHELAHAASGWHHGETDYEELWAFVNGVLQGVPIDRDRNPIGPPRPIVVKTEDDRILTPAELFSSGAPQDFFRIGTYRGQHSGWETCFLRYDVAQAYIAQADPMVRYWVGEERRGPQLCEFILGTTVNALDRVPQSRYGPATDGRGRCKFQMFRAQNPAAREPPEDLFRRQRELHSAVIALSDGTPPVLAVPERLERNATGPDGAIVTFTVAVTDDTDPSPAIACAPASGSTFPIGDTAVACIATDSSGNSASASFGVHVKRAPEQIADLIETIRRLGLATRVEQWLLAPLLRAATQLHAGNTLSACGALHPFLSTVKRLSRNGLTADAASELETAGLRIAAVLACR